ncbi:MAG: Penicillin-binding protein 2 [Parcubacteria group bacterium GW2011_GWC1_36_9]|uniref:Penicillin-binding protein 2 n=1 Tax=Candidatus Yanofskybacteria bacterium GW2011_GWC2_37_9 TaxID=1619028 RepID=A0A0G0I730_9BACT|nr:MAG: Penicillin-binding protein 2 [Parcubacteria group bacterium GW2011_GWC1_36_9]KKQ28433.1 MAG: Penicillin-binding protein 2 [Parcubacteria group bacterium GW2011_GWB1_37_13]KKQ46785.1 MAG: Penicillin-binding protein 2 [Candidatus Yanofskybacteria bacterium GW2011_GWC2_37_9]
MNFRKFTKNKKKNTFVEPDEIFLDSKNLQNFDRQQFEGRIEKPIPRKTINLLGTSFLLIIILFGIRLVYLQVGNGDNYRKRSENNILEKVIIFTERGIIYDRNKKELAWNKKTEGGTDLVVGAPLGAPTTKLDSLLYTRVYTSSGFSHILGYVSYPTKDNAGNYWQTEFKGIDGLEKEYNDKIKGENGSKIIETDAKGVIHSENIINAPKQGSDLITSIDSRIQKQLFALIKNSSQDNGFIGGGAVIMDVQNGEIITSTSFPEYDSEILSLGKDTKKINDYMNDKRKIFLDKTISGLYTPGSIVKPFLSLGALAEGVIDPYKKILSTGSISIQNPYFEDQKTVFKDWRVNGWTDMAQALAVSSDIYFYEIGGGYEDQKGLGIANIEKYAKLFGFKDKTGVDLPDETEGTIPSPEWKMKNFKGDIWRIGDTYNTAIGQYGFQVTPIEVARAVSAIANNGKLLTPHFILGDMQKENLFSTVNFKKEYFDVVHNGMRQAVTYGTASALNVPYVEVAAKTGTAQLGVKKNKVNSWVVGFFPYKNPKYAFTIMMEAGPSANNVNASSVMRQLLDWMSINTPEYFL